MAGGARHGQPACRSDRRGRRGRFGCGQLGPVRRQLGRFAGRARRYPPLSAGVAAPSRRDRSAPACRAWPRRAVRHNGCCPGRSSGSGREGTVSLRIHGATDADGARLCSWRNLFAGPVPTQQSWSLSGAGGGKEDGFGCLFECQFFCYFSSIMDK